MQAEAADAVAQAKSQAADEITELRGEFENRTKESQALQERTEAKAESQEQSRRQAERRLQNAVGQIARLDE
ncbi:MAG: hypothetical protein ACYSX1_04025, partial [Planctomycetota bacterium]